MKQTLQVCLAIVAQAMFQCASLPSDAATVAPVFTNDTVANTLSFNDTFGHTVAIGTYNPATGLWTSTGVAGGFTNLTVSGNATVAGTFGVTGVTTVGPIVINGAMSGSGLTAAFASPPPIGNTAANSVAATTLSASSTVSGAGFNSLIAAPPVGFGSVTPNGVAATSLSASGLVSGTGFSNYLLSPPAFGNTAPNTGKFTSLQATTTTNFLDQMRSLQSFGAAGNGSTDDTTAVSTALNSGVPLLCNGTFKLTSLVTITNVNVYLQGAGSGGAAGMGCVFNYANTSTMIYATLTGADQYLGNQFVMKDVKIVPQANITSVTGPPGSTAAGLYINYPLGQGGITLPSVILDNINIKPSSAANCIRNGIVLNDVGYSWLEKINYEGCRTTPDPLSNAMVYTGTHSPTTLHVEHSTADYAGIGISAPQQTTNGWQGMRVHGFDCVFCNEIIEVDGSLDNTSDYVDFSGVEGAFVSTAISVLNVKHALIHENYFFANAVTNFTNPPTSICINVQWNLSIPVNGAASYVGGNACDQTNGTAAAKLGINLTGTSGTGMASVLGTNELTGMNNGVVLNANTSGWVINKQAVKGITTEFTDNGTVGGNFTVPPLATANGGTAPAGAVGEVKFANFGTPLGVTNASITNVGSISLTPGNWVCTGEIQLLPAATTTTSQAYAAVNVANNALGVAGPGQAIGGSGVASTGYSIISMPLYLSLSATTTYFLNTDVFFAASTMQVTGSLQCRRYM